MSMQADSHGPAGTMYVSCQIPTPPRTRRLHAAHEGRCCPPGSEAQATRNSRYCATVFEEQPTPPGQIEAAVALTVLYEPVLLSLRRMAHAEESARRSEAPPLRPRRPRRPRPSQI